MASTSSFASEREEWMRGGGESEFRRAGSRASCSVFPVVSTVKKVFLKRAKGKSRKRSFKLKNGLNYFL